MATIVAADADDATDDRRPIEIDGSTPTPVTVERVVERIIERPMRRRLPDTRRSITHRFNVAGHEGYLTAGLYESGEPGELFITMSKEGSTIGGLMDSLGTAISVALQYGVPLESLVKKFEHQRFEPMGMTTNRDVPFAKSLVDYIFRWMGMEFIPGYREKNAPPRTERNRHEGRTGEWTPATRTDASTAQTERAEDLTTSTRPSHGGQRVVKDKTIKRTGTVPDSGGTSPSPDRNGSAGGTAAPRGGSEDLARTSVGRRSLRTATPPRRAAPPRR